MGSPRRSHRALAVKTPSPVLGPFSAPGRELVWAAGGGGRGDWRAGHPAAGGDGPLRRRTHPQHKHHIQGQASAPFQPTHLPPQPQCMALSPMGAHPSAFPSLPAARVQPPGAQMSEPASPQAPDSRPGPSLPAPTVAHHSPGSVHFCQPLAHHIRSTLLQPCSVSALQMLPVLLSPLVGRPVSTGSNPQPPDASVFTSTDSIPSSLSQSLQPSQYLTSSRKPPANTPYLKPFQTPNYKLHGSTKQPGR